MKTDRELLELAAKAAGKINVFACDAAEHSAQCLAELQAELNRGGM